MIEVITKSYSNVESRDISGSSWPNIWPFSTSYPPFKIQPKSCKLPNITRSSAISPRARAMRRVSWNLANCHTTVQKLGYLYDKSWRNRSYEVGGLQWDSVCNKYVHSTMTPSSRFHCPIGVINKPTTDELCISPVYRRLAVAKFSKSTM